MKGIYCLLIVFGFLHAGAQTDYGKLGQVFRIGSSHSMFPDSMRNKEPRVYQGKTFSAAEHYSDSSAFVFVPAYFDKSKPFHFVLWFHGWGNCIDTALKQFQLVEQFSEAHQNAIFVFPEGPKQAPDSYAGKFEQPKQFDLFMQDVQDFLQKEKAITAMQLNDLVLAGHSGAYRAISYILLHTHRTTSGVFLFDALYGEEEKFAMQLQKNPACKFIDIYTENGGTMQNSKDLMVDMDAWKWKYVQLEEDACTAADLKSNRFIFLHSKKAHNDVITNNNNFERFLRSL